MQRAKGMERDRYHRVGTRQHLRASANHKSRQYGRHGTPAVVLQGMDEFAQGPLIGARAASHVKRRRGPDAPRAHAIRGPIRREHVATALTPWRNETPYGGPARLTDRSVERPRERLAACRTHGCHEGPKQSVADGDKHSPSPVTGCKDKAETGGCSRGGPGPRGRWDVAGVETLRGNFHALGVAPETLEPVELAR